MKLFAIFALSLFSLSALAAVKPLKNKTLFKKSSIKKSAFAHKENLDFVFKKPAQKKQMQEEKVSIKIEEYDEKKK